MDIIIHAVGKRKTSVARVYLMSGEGNIRINKTSLERYFHSESSHAIIKQPLQLTGVIGQYDININVKGGGFTGQAEACRLGISRALCKVDPSFRLILRKAGLITRISKQVESKKPGRKKARKRYQFSKR